MTGRSNNILKKTNTKNNSLIKRGFILCFGLLLLVSNEVLGQVISNTGAAVSVTSGIVVNSKDIENTAGTLGNNGTINLTGNFTSTATTNGNGTFTIGGNWTNSGGIFIPGISTVIFNGSANQFITRAGGENFFNLSISNTGTGPANIVSISNNITVAGTLSMSTGNVDAASFVLYLSNQTAASLNYTSVTGSRIFGKFERGVSQSATYLFPLGTSSYYNPANLITNSVSTPGTVLSEFITSPPPGNAGLPVSDPPVEIAYAYPNGFWGLTANGFSSSDYSINLNASGFTDTIFDVTRVIKRTGGGNWIVDGTHADATDPVVFRNNLTGGISTSGTQFALGRSRPLITVHPLALLYACEDTDPSFSVTATGAELLTYRWYKEPGTSPLTNGADYTGARTPTLTILNAQLDDAGNYYCIVTDRYGMKTRSNNGTLIVNRIPVATVTPSLQGHECSNIAFEDIVLGESYGVPLTTYTWSRNNPAGITSPDVPMNGSALIIGDILSGTFANSTDVPVTVTFTIYPTGQAPTYCMGLPVTATVTVNPTPRVVAVNSDPVICYDGSTAIRLTTPTTMTNGVIQFDYTVSTTGGTVVGNTAPANNLGINYNIIFPYKNNSDTIQSVFYDVTPKNMVSGCFSGPVVRAEVKINPHPLQSGIIITQPLTCDGGSDASLHIDISRGTGPYYMVWYGPQGFVKREGYGLTDFTGLPGGQYDVTVTDNHGCQNAATTSVTGAIIDSRLFVPTKPNGYHTSCPESADAELRIRQNSSSTGTPPFTYHVVYNSQDTIITDILYSTGVYNYYYNMPPGNYKLYLKDANGCSDYTPRETNIVAPPQITVAFDKKVYAGGYNVSCKGYNDGSVWVKTVTGGSGGYTYLWYTIDGLITGSATQNRLDNIPMGTYYLITKDLNNCTKLDSVTLTEPLGMVLTGSELSLSADGDYNISCSGGSNGHIKMNITGGSGVYTYAWSGPNGFTASTKDISGLKAGNYSCLVTDLNGCTLMPVPAYTLSEPAPLDVVLTPSLSVTGLHNINCFGGTGSIELTVTGGSTGNYTFAWITADGSGIVSGQEDQLSLTAGTYSVTITDLNGCQLTKVMTLTQPQALKTKLTPFHITCQSAGFDNGSVDLLITGGIAPFSYVWSNGATTEDLSGLTQGSYKVTVTDANGCVTTDSTIVNLPPPLSFNKVVSEYYGYNITCNGMSNGYIRINPEGGAAPFIYTWTGSDGFTSTSKDLFGLKAGVYNLMLTDSNLCTVTETFTLTEPGKLDMIVTLSASNAGGFNINCVGGSTGSIGIEPVNQVGFVNYFWSDGSVDKMRTNLTAGDYGLIITDMNNCHADSVITLIEPDSIKIMFDVSKPLCPDMPDGEIRLTVTGGVRGADYLYRWSDNSTGRNLSNIVKGLYEVFVTDMNGCTVKDSITIEPRNETCLVIPNAISPNGDLINDVWNIGLIELYPQIEIKIFNRWGESIWRSEKGYPQPWDGRSNGKQLPIDSYHYIIDLHNGSKPYIGNVTIVR